MRKHIIFILFCLWSIAAHAQYSFSADASALRETKWRYTFTAHVESNRVLHKAERNYQYYLYFRFDNLYRQFLNGSSTTGSWTMQGTTLNYEFQDIKQFRVVEVTSERLVLEFERSNSRGFFQYHFVNADTDHPFPRPANELSMVVIKAKKNAKTPWWANLNAKERKERMQEKQVYINIELVGGGFIGSLDPVSRDYIRIKNDGRLIQEYKSSTKGLVVTKKNISRKELEAFCEYVVSQKFFEFNREYDCDDNACLARKKYKPRPNPLRLSIAYGNRKKVVTIAIWGQDDRRIRYVNYPPALDNIIDAIQRFAHRLES